MGRKSIDRKRKNITPRVQKWLAALLIKLQDQDIERLTIDDIAELANKSKSTIYEYFESKEEILKSVCETRVNTLSAMVSKAKLKLSEPTERLEELVEAFSLGISDISFLFLESIHKHYPEAWEVINVFTEDFVVLLKNLYEEGMATGEYQNISIELLTYLDKHFVTQMVTNPGIFSDSTYTLSHLLQDYLNLRLYGLKERT